MDRTEIYLNPRTPGIPAFDWGTAKKSAIIEQYRLHCYKLFFIKKKIGCIVATNKKKKKEMYSRGRGGGSKK